MKRVLPILVSLFFLTTLPIKSTSAYLIKGLETEVDTAEIETDGKYYVLLIDVCKANGIDWEWDSVSRKITLRKNGNEVVSLVGSKYYYIGEKIRNLSAPVLMKNGSIYVPLRFAKYTVKRLFELEKKLERRTDFERREPEVKRPSGKRYRINKIVIDPGHGGRDPGAISKTGLQEKELVLDVSKRIKRELEKNGIEVVMTRDSDRFIPLRERTQVANRIDADLFISIHANASRSRWQRGFEVYFLSEATDDNARALASSENSVLRYEESSFARHTKDLDAIIWDLTFTENREESIEIAGFICQEVCKILRPKENKVKSARFYVLKGAEMPAVLVELSYLSNKYDERYLRESDYRQKLAKGIASGIIGYKHEYERANGFSR